MWVTGKANYVLGQKVSVLQKVIDKLIRIQPKNPSSIVWRAEWENVQNASEGNTCNR